MGNQQVRLAHHKQTFHSKAALTKKEKQETKAKEERKKREQGNQSKRNIPEYVITHLYNSNSNPDQPQTAPKTPQVNTKQSQNQSSNTRQRSQSDEQIQELGNNSSRIVQKAKLKTPKPNKRSPSRSNCIKSQTQKNGGMSNSKKEDFSSEIINFPARKEDYTSVKGSECVLNNYYNRRTTVIPQLLPSYLKNLDREGNIGKDIAVQESPKMEAKAASSQEIQIKTNRFATRMVRHMTTFGEKESNHTRAKSLKEINGSNETNTNGLDTIAMASLECKGQDQSQQIDSQIGSMETPFNFPPNVDVMMQDMDQKEMDDMIEDFAIQSGDKEYKMSVMKDKSDSSCKDLVTNAQSLFDDNTFDDQKPKHQGKLIKSKSSNDLRLNLLTKLAQSRVLVPRVGKISNHQQMIVFDWDDTLMPSTFLAPLQSQIMKEQVRRRLPLHVRTLLEALEEQVIKLLKAALKVGPTYIITNAGHGWVQLSSMRFFPKLYKEIIRDAANLDLQIISARQEFEKELPSGFKEWKLKSFLKVAEILDKNTITNIVAIGDSQIEIDAANNLAKNFDEACVKTVKLKERPSLLELSKQVELLNNSFQGICSSGKNLTIRLQKQDAEEEKNSYKVSSNQRQRERDSQM